MLEKTQRHSQNHAWQLDKGLKRETNEDCLNITETLQISEEKAFSLGIYVIADGIAGMSRASRIAARVASQVFLHQFQIHEPMTHACQDWLQSAIEMAHSMVQAGNKLLAPMEAGTTIVMAVVLDNQLYVGNVGDSRAYIISSQEIRQVSQDHTMAAALIASGFIGPDEFIKPALRNRLSQAIGIGDAIRPNIYNESLLAGDYLLLCSDGLHSQIDDDTIFQIIRQSSTPQYACEALIQAANDAGGEDNISVILVKIQWS